MPRGKPHPGTWLGPRICSDVNGCRNSMATGSGPSLTQPPFKALFSVLYMGTLGQLWAAQAPQSQSHHLPSPSQLQVRKPHPSSRSPLAALTVLAQILTAAKGSVGVLRLLRAHPQSSQTRWSLTSPPHTHGPEGCLGTVATSCCPRWIST